MELLEYILYEEEEKGISYYAKIPVIPDEKIKNNKMISIEKSDSSRQVKAKKKYRMSDEELRCFALQCNDYVEKRDTEYEEHMENNDDKV